MSFNLNEPITEEHLESLGLIRYPKRWLGTHERFCMTIKDEELTTFLWFEPGNGYDSAYWNVYCHVEGGYIAQFCNPPAIRIRCGIQYMHQVEAFMKAFTME